MVFGSSAVSLTERVSARCKGDRLFVVHGHAAERFSNVLGAEQGVGVCIGALWIDVDEAHLDRSKWVFEVLAGIAIAVVSKPLVLASPVRVVFGLPNVRSASTKTKDGSAHGFNGDLASENQKVSPTDGVAVLLLDGPEQASSLVEVAVVRPTVERSKPLCTGCATAAAIASAVGPSGVPGHSNEEGAVVTVISRPPVLAVGHQSVKVRLQASVVKVLERLSIVKIRTHWVGFHAVLMKDTKIESFWPPILIRSLV